MTDFYNNISSKLPEKIRIFEEQPQAENFEINESNKKSKRVIVVACPNYANFILELHFVEAAWTFRNHWAFQTKSH